ncbi:hypothetical protein [Methylothermus subterraneus]
MRGSPGPNRPLAPFVFGANRLFVALPILAVGWIDDQIIERAPGVLVVGEHAAESEKGSLCLTGTAASLGRRPCGCTVMVHIAERWFALKRFLLLAQLMPISILQSN